MHARHGFFTSGLVLLIALVLLLISTYQIASTQKQRQVEQVALQKQSFSMLSQKFSKIMEITSQCTCNLKGLKLSGTADLAANVFTPSYNTLIDSGNLDSAGRGFGSYNIKTDGSCDTLDVAYFGLGKMQASAEFGFFKASQINFSNLQVDNTGVVPTGSTHITGKLSVAGRFPHAIASDSAGGLTSTSTNANPLDLDLQVSVNSTSGEIEQCYIVQLPPPPPVVKDCNDPGKPANLSCCQYLAQDRKCEFNDTTTGAPIDFFNTNLPPGFDNSASRILTGEQKAWLFTANCLARKVPFTSDQTGVYGQLPLAPASVPAIKNKAGQYTIPYQQNFKNGPAQIKINGRDCTVNSYYNTNRKTNYHSDWDLNITCDGITKTFHWLSGDNSLEQTPTSCSLCEGGYKNASQILGESDPPSGPITRCGQDPLTGGAKRCQYSATTGEPTCQ